MSDRALAAAPGHPITLRGAPAAQPTFVGTGKPGPTVRDPPTSTFECVGST